MDFNNIMEQIQNPENVTDMFTPEEVQKNKISAVLATFPILFWMPLVIDSNSGYGKFYANQGLIELIVSAVLSAAAGILSLILGLIPFLGGVLAGIIGLVVGLVNFGLWLFLFIAALQDKAVYLPVVGKMFTAFK